MAYSKDQIAAVVAQAKKIAGAAAADPKLKSIGVFDLLKGGRCQEFVRECFETALGLKAGSWKYAKASAKDAITAMAADGLRVTGAPIAGDVIGHCSGAYGHIAIVVDAKTCAENTSSASRGNPRRAGTKLTPLEDMIWTHVIRFTPQAAAVTPTAPKKQMVKLIDHGTGAVIAEYEMVLNGNHIADQGKLYVAKR